jgi:prevent-host-death family protein
MVTFYGSADFKARCLQILDEVASTGQSVVVTKRGKPVARLTAFEVAEPVPAYGYLVGTARWDDDLLSTDETWNADR